MHRVRFGERDLRAEENITDKVDRLVPKPMTWPDNALATTRSILLQVLVEPVDGLFQPIDLMLWFDEHMAFAGIDDQFCWYA
jgi:hypothetical protein